MEIITSKQNSAIKQAKALHEKSNREITSCFLVEGFKIIEEAKNSDYKIKTIFCLEKYYEKARQYCQNVVLINEIIVKYLSTTISPQGVIGIIEQKQEIKPLSVNEKFLILDKIQNPDNLGGIIRSAVAFGFNHIFLLNCCDKFNEKVIRSAMGNLFKIAITKTNIQTLQKLSKEHNIYCADINGKNISTVKFESNCGFVVGNEGNGVSQEVLKLCKKSVCIPMQNNVESLNVAISASILMYEISKKEN